MANPVKRHSKSRKNKRRSHDALTAPTTSVCPQCNEHKLPHRACPHCGFYKGREVISADRLS
ncbi:MAG TPA: 50S ribosomal protein L32 [Deltaproteobacteria bacterium]|nr:50S ribosomal protein L32 [Deltaproteobacteria bacterium]